MVPILIYHPRFRFTVVLVRRPSGCQTQFPRDRCLKGMKDHLLKKTRNQKRFHRKRILKEACIYNYNEQAKDLV